MAPDKDALLPGQAPSFANVTSYTRGINGVFIDVQNLSLGPTYLSESDFAFRVNRGGGWSAAPAPVSIGRDSAAGVDGSDRVAITWADGAIRNTWLEVTVKSTPATGLPAPDTFYFGNLVGETGDGGWPLRVTALDVAAVKRAAAANAPAALANPYDFNRDGAVNALDVAAARGNRFNSLVPPAAAGTVPVPGALETLLLRRAGVWEELLNSTPEESG
jgi:hypothetical protein